MNQEHEIVLYQIDDTNICVNVIFKDETFLDDTKGDGRVIQCKCTSYFQTFIKYI